MKKRVFLITLISILLITLLFFVTCNYNALYGVGNDVDVENPSLEISSPGNGEIFRVFNITGKASDDVELDKIKVETSGVSKSVNFSNGKGTQNWSVAINAITDNLSDGEYKFTITAIDKAGRKTKKYLNLTIDKSGPAISVLSPTFQDDPQTTSLTGASIQFDISVYDPHGINQTSTNNKMIIYTTDINSPIWNTQLVMVSAQNEGLWTGQTALNTNTIGYTGAAKIRITLEDTISTENIGVWERNVLISPESDTPVLVLDLPNPNSNPPETVGRYLTIHGYAQDNSEITKILFNIKKPDNSYVYAITQEIVNSNSSNRYFFEFSKEIDTNPLGLTTGVYTIEARAVDNSSNQSSTQTTQFQVDATLPTLTFTSNTPEVGSYQKSNFLVEVQCSMDDATVEYKVIQSSLDTGWNPWGTMTKTGNLFSKTIDVTSLKSTYNFQDGSIMVKLRATKGTKFSETSRIFNIDTTAPTLTIISHTDNQHVNGAVTLTGSVFDRMGFYNDKVEIFNPDPAINNWVEVNINANLWSYQVSSDSAGQSIEEKFGVTAPATLTRTFTIRIKDRAENQTQTTLNLIIDPGQDIPIVTLLTPATNGSKVSGNLSILAVMDDDDYPAKDMTANITVYDDVTSLAVATKNFSKTDSGFPNLTMIIDTSTLVDSRSYTIKVNGTDWHGKTAPEVTRSFIVDKNVPIITLTSPTNNSYLTNSITFTGTVKDENNISSFTLSYIDNNNVNQTRNIQNLTYTGMDGTKKVYSFTATLNGSGSDTNLDGADINWGNNEWGNNTRLFTIKAVDETGLIGYSYTSVNLDNNTPQVTITAPSNGYVIGYGASTLQIIGSLNDTPTAGTSYPLSFNMLKITVDGDLSPETTIKDFTDPSTNFTGTPESFAYTWNYSSFADDNYIIRIYARDNALNQQSPVTSISVVKNQYPPVVNTISFTTKTHYKGVISFTVNAQDRGTLPNNGVSKLELLVDDVVQSSYTRTWSSGSEPLTVNEVFNFDTASYGSDGNHEVKFRVTDKSGVTDTKSAGILLFDNGAPNIATPVYYTTDYASPITSYSTYLKFNVTVTDIYSLSGDTPQFCLGTTSGGNDIFDWSYFNTINWNGQNQYTATIDSYIDLFSYYNATVYLTVRSTDTAGNIKTSTFSIPAASSLPSLNFNSPNNAYISDRLDSNPGNGFTTITGTVDSTATAVWIKVDTGSEVSVTSFGSGTWSHSFSNSSISDGIHAFRIRTIKNGVQNIVTRTFKVDNTSPIVSISSTITYTTGSGYVYNNDLSGVVRISGTFSDNNGNFMDKSEANLQININSAGWITIPTANIVHNYDADWTWYYDWNTETLSTVVGNNISIQVRANDLAANSNTDQITRNVVPFIYSITSQNSTTYPVLDTKFYQNSSWANHNNRRYSMKQGSPIYINGFNLKRGTTTPTVTLNAFSFTVTSSSINQIAVTIPSNDTNGRSGNITVTTDGITSLPVWVNIWRSARIGDDYDTFDARSFDMSLTSTGTAFITFARDHQVSPEYVTAQVDDYCTYRIDEGATTAYNNYGAMDPMFFTANSIMDNYRYMASCLDEWTGSDVMIIKRTLNTDTTRYADRGSGNGTYTYLTSSDGRTRTTFNTVKYGSMVTRNTGSGNGYIYLALYDDDSRATPPVPRLYLTSGAITSYALATTYTAQLVTNSNNPGPWNSVSLTSTGYPVVVYHTQTNNKLNMIYNTSSYTPTTFTSNANVQVNGGKYCSLTIDSSNLISISYQDSSIGLSYMVLNNVTDTSPTVIAIEEASNDGITGFNSSICLNSSRAPYISYLNNSLLNSNRALRVARFTGSTISKTELANRANWEYMSVPTDQAVNSERTVIKWDSTNNRPVIAYKANGYIYVSRLIL